MLYHPEKEQYPLSYYQINNTVEISLNTKDEFKLQAWFKPADTNCDMVVFYMVIQAA